MDLEDAAVIRRDTKVKLHMTAHHAVAWGSLSGHFWGVLTGLLFAFPIAPLFRCSGRHHGRRVRRCGISGSRTISNAACRNWSSPAPLRCWSSSARSPSTGSWKRCGPTVAQCCRLRCRTATEQELMKALHGDNSSAPTWERPADAAVARA